MYDTAYTLNMVLFCHFYFGMLMFYCTVQSMRLFVYMYIRVLHVVCPFVIVCLTDQLYYFISVQLHHCQYEPRQNLRSSPRTERMDTSLGTFILQLSLLLIHKDHL